LNSARRNTFTSLGSIFGMVWLMGLIAVLAVGCGSDNNASTSTSLPSETTGTSVSPPTPTPTLSPAEQIDQDIKGLLSRDATWQAPSSLRVDETANIALSIGDAKSLRDEIANIVPTVEPRPPEKVNIGSTVRVQLTADTSDASITPLEAIDNSIGEQTSMLFSWQVHPRKSGELILVAHIQFPLSNAGVRDQIVSLRIPVDNTLSHIFFSIVQNFWTQLVAVAGVAGTAAKFVWNWYRRRRESHGAPRGNRNAVQRVAAEETRSGSSDPKPSAVGADPQPASRPPSVHD
jgi:hypothetical protein